MKRKQHTNGSVAGIDEMDNENRLRLLGIIDQFRELGVNEDISLPQLVVVGDQSSGKSSLLEGLTGLSFPIASDLCTRFATQIVLHRAPAEDASIKVSIIPGPIANANEEQKQHLLEFGHRNKLSGLGAEAFGKILDEAAVHMGLPSTQDSNVEDLDKRFSDDVLKIELTGPQHHHLSVVDVPGLFHNPTKYQTNEDLDIIRALIEKYITDPRTIILAVMDARNNLANQEVFHMARSADPQGLRTVGIITKCDALQSGDETGVLNIAQNSVERLHHGWFAVKNRSTKEIKQGVSIEERHVRERQFFDTSPWNTLPKDRVGIKALKEFLGKLLYEHIQSEFPALVREIRGHVLKCREDMTSLGPSRQTFIEQRQFLTRLAASYQGSVRDSLTGNYDASWEPQDPRKLRMHLQVTNEAFGKFISEHGYTRPFRNADDSIDHAFSRAGCEDEESIYDWIRTLYRDSRGSELPGTINPSVLELMFRQQSKKWDEIAVEHVKKISLIISDFNDAVFGGLIGDDTLRNKVEYRNSCSARDTNTEASEQLKRILNDEMGGILQTVNHYFADTLSEMREERVVNSFKRIGLEEGSCQTINFESLTSAVHLSNEDQAVIDIHDILKAYYKVALKRFTDNVVLQVVERCFLGPDGPCRHISPEYMGGLADDELRDLAAESYSTSSARNELRVKLERLEKALSIAEDQRI